MFFTSEHLWELNLSVFPSVSWKLLVDFGSLSGNRSMIKTLLSEGQYKALSRFPFLSCPLFVFCRCHITSEADTDLYSKCINKTQKTGMNLLQKFISNHISFPVSNITTGCSIRFIYRKYDKQQSKHTSMSSLHLF